MKIASISFLKACSQKISPSKSRVIVLYHLKRASAVLLSVLLAVSALMLSPAIPALADQADPDSTPTISGGHLGVNAYRYLLESGDVGFLVYANIPYAATPTALENEAFMWQLLSVDGSTVIGQTTGYPYRTSGYGYNAFWFYFSAADNVTWGSAYILRLTGNPVVFLTPPTYDFVLQAGDYTSSTTQAANQEELELRIIEISQDLYQRWSLTATTTLLTQSESGTRLSTLGESFWRGAVYGCQAFAPGVFEFGMLTITRTSHMGTTAYADNLSSQYTGTWIATSKQGGADFFDLDYDLMSTLLVIVFCIGVMFMEQKISGNIWFGLTDAALLAVIFGRQGLYDVTFLAMLAALMWLYVSARVWGMVR